MNNIEKLYIIIFEDRTTEICKRNRNAGNSCKPCPFYRHFKSSNTANKFCQEIIERIAGNWNDNEI